MFVALGSEGSNYWRFVISNKGGKDHDVEPSQRGYMGVKLQPSC
jgi:hypothetical protein